MTNDAETSGITRRDALRRGATVAAGGALLATPLITAAGARAATSSASCKETVEQIVSIAAVAEALAVTTYWAGIRSGNVFNQITPASGNRPYLRGALSEEDYHLNLLLGAGAAKPPATFHYPTGTFDSLKGFAATVEALEDAFISAYGAAVGRFCELGQPDLAQLAYRIGGVEAEHRFAIRDVVGEALPNNLCLEPALFTCVSDAAGALGPFLTGGKGFTEVRHMPSAAEIKWAISGFGCQ